MDQFEITAELREDLGKGASRRLRHAGKIPAVLYGGEKDAQSVTLSHSQIIRFLDFEGFYSHVLTMNVAGEEQTVVLKDIQRHPYKPFIQHMDFQRVAKDTVLHMHIPLHFINEENCVGVKLAGGMIAHQMTDVEVHCTADALPEYIEVDLADLEMGHSLHLSDLILPEGVVIPALAHGPDHDLPVASVQKTRAGADADSAEEGEE